MGEGKLSVSRDSQDYKYSDIGFQELDRCVSDLIGLCILFLST